MNKKRVLLTGATGLLGVNWMALRSEVYYLVGVVRNNKFFPPGFKSVNLNCEKLEDIESYLKSENIDMVVHAAGFTSVDECERNPQRAHEDNVLLSERIALACKKTGKKLVYVSTDHIFGGNGSFFREEDPTEIVNVYARTKFEAEKVVAAHCPDSLIVRTNFFGWGPKYRPSLNDWIVSKLSNGEYIDMYQDIFYSPLYVGNLIETIEKLLIKEASGVFHVVGGERVSKYEFAMKLADEMGLNKGLIRPVHYNPKKSNVRRPKDMSLSTEKLDKVLGVPSAGVSENITALLKAREKGLDKTVRSAVAPAPQITIPYGRHALDEDDIAAVVDVLRTKWLTQGTIVEEFEKSVADYVGSRYAVAISSWTAGLHIAAAAAHVGPGDNVITTPMSFVATSNCAIYMGAN